MNDKNNYNSFLKQKEIKSEKSGFVVQLSDLNDMLFDWQKMITKWAIARGKAAIFADCGLGKTPMQLEWANHIHKKTKKPILILAPLAVSKQTKVEGDKFHIPVNICNDMSDVINRINITNYEKLHKFDVSKFSGVVLDESSILKNFSGIRRNEIINAFKNTLYKLACTATPSPNDFMELGNHSEFLNILTRSEMLSMFFINDTGNVGHWRLKGHVKNNLFWQWMASWSVMITKPSDIGYEDGDFDLPNITYHEHIIKTKVKPKYGFGLIRNNQTLNDRRKIRKETIGIRCKEAADIINPTDDKWVIWCNLNDEGDQLERDIEKIVQVAGRHDNELKEKRMLGFAKGDIERIVTKPKIAGLGMNWQICHKAAFIGLSDSWEQFYQAVRRIWRFGQTGEVEIHIILEEREQVVLENIKRKESQARQMISNMVLYMKDLTKTELKQTQRQLIDYCPSIVMEVPVWL